MTTIADSIFSKFWGSDIESLCIIYAVNIDFHENKNEYFFSDESSLILEISE